MENIDSRELEIKEKWSPIKSQSDDNIKQIAKDLYNGLIYTDRYCGDNEIIPRFIPLCLVEQGIKIHLLS